MVIVYDEDYLRKYMNEAVSVSEERPVLIDDFLEDAIEVDVDCIADGETTVIGAIMEHVELAGVHSGDSACVIPAPTLTAEVKDQIRQDCYALAKELKVIGLMNIQYAIKDNVAYILEVNPRASRTIPYVSKAIGVPLAKLAALVMAGRSLKDMGFIKEIIPKHFSAKEAVFPFERFPGSHISLSPEMKSTGEVMGVDASQGISYFKSQVAAGNHLPRQGNVFLSVKNEDQSAVIPLAQRLIELGFVIYATRGTSTALHDHKIKSNAIFKIKSGRPNILDLIYEGNVSWIIHTTTSGVVQKIDEMQMRMEAVSHGIPITTTINGLKAAISGLEALREIERMDVRSLQEYHRYGMKLNV